MDSEANKALARRYIEMWNTDDTAIADEILSPVWHDHNHPKKTGLDHIKQAVLNSRTAFPDYHRDIEVMISEGDFIALRTTFTRNGEGSLSLSRVMLFLRVENGKLAELWTGAEAVR